MYADRTRFRTSEVSACAYSAIFFVNHDAYRVLIGGLVRPFSDFDDPAGLPNSRVEALIEVIIEFFVAWCGTWLGFNESISLIVPEFRNSWGKAERIVIVIPNLGSKHVADLGVRLPHLVKNHGQVIELRDMPEVEAALAEVVLVPMVLGFLVEFFASEEQIRIRAEVVDLVLMQQFFFVAVLH